MRWTKNKGQVKRRNAIQLTLLSVLIGLFAIQAYGAYGPNGEGRLLWHYKPEGSDVFDWCQPAIIHDKETGKRTIIYGEGDEVGGGRLYAVDADTHKAVWGPIDFPGPIGNSPATVSINGRRIYFGEGSKPGKVYCVDSTDGNIIWTATGMPEDAGAFMSCGALSYDEKTFYIGSGAWPEDANLADNRFYAIDTATGNLKWIFKSQTHPEERESESGASNYGSFFCDPAILMDGRIVAATFSGHVYCIKDLGLNAKMLWDFEHIDRNATGWMGRTPFHQEIWGSPAIDKDGTIYIGSNSGKVHAIDSETGKLKWETERTGGEIFGAPVIGVDGNIYASAEDHYLYVWRPPSQPPSDPKAEPVAPISRCFWKDRWPNGATVLANGEVVFGGEKGNKYVSVKLVDGKLIRQWESDPVGESDENEAKTEPLIDPVTYTIYVSGGHSGGLYALKGTQPMANTPWPKVQRDIRNSGRAEVK
ncbi:MAG: outer membrane protein assembly factor BamB family protein [Planctomycetota bacterium]|jgi:outer membrane protein assembly factor BamB